MTEERLKEIEAAITPETKWSVSDLIASTRELIAEVRRLQYKLERTEGHMKRKLDEEEAVNQKIYDELHKENQSLRELLKEARLNIWSESAPICDRIDAALGKKTE